MSISPTTITSYEIQNLDWLKKISLRLDELSVLQRI